MKKQFLLGLMAMLLPLTLWAQDGPTKTKLVPTFAEGVTMVEKVANVVYAGTATQTNLGITLKAGDQTLNLYTDYQLTYKWTGNGEGATEKEVAEIRNAGKYTVSVNITGFSYKDLYEVEDFDVVVNPLDVSTTGLIVPSDNTTPVNLEYGDELKLDEFITIAEGKLAANTDAVAEKTNLLSGLQVVAVGESAGTPIKEVGKYSVAVDGVKEHNPSNYIYNRTAAGVTYELNINKKQLYMTLKGKVYNKGMINLTYLGNKEKGQYTLYTDSEKKVEATAIATNATIEFTYDPKDNNNVENKSGLNAGKYNLRAEITGDESTKAHYTLGDGTFEYEISKANLVIEKSTSPAAVLTKTYGEKDPDLTKQFTYTRQGSDNDLALTEDEFKALNLTMERVPGENVYATDGKTKAQYAISPKVKDDAELTNYKIVYNYNGKAADGKTDLEPSVLMINAKSLNKDSNGTPTEGIVLTQPKDEDKTVTYAAKDFVQDPGEIEGLSLTDNGLKIATLKKDLDLGTDYKLVFSAEVNTNTTRGKAVDAGDIFNISLVGLGNYTGEVYSLNYTVKKDTLTITPKDDAVFAKVWDNREYGDLTGLFDFKGLHEVDEEGKPSTQGVLTMKYYNMTEGKKVNVDVCQPNGTYIPTNQYLSPDPKQGLKNYIIKYTPVKFTTLPAEFKLNGDPAYADGEDEVVTNTQKIQQYAGLEVDKPTIENLTSLNNAGYGENKWYTLVLPFEVTAREISNMFGYAIVNVPQESNNDPATMVFRLTMGTIPAHTPMAFKVDADEKRAKNPTLTFETGKTIVAVPENSFADILGNKAIGTYEKVEIDGEYEFFLLPSTGNFYRASKWATDHEGKGMAITPFNIYFDFSENQVSDARIILEEADGSTTAINAVTGETIHNAAEGWYTIGGVKLNAQPTEKGVYINNGMKVVIK